MEKGMISSENLYHLIKDGASFKEVFELVGWYKF